MKLTALSIIGDKCKEDNLGDNCFYGNVKAILDL